MWRTFGESMVCLGLSRGELGAVRGLRAASDILFHGEEV